MRLFVCGSAPLLPSTFAEFEARCGHRILERYILTGERIVVATRHHWGKILEPVAIGKRTRTPKQAPSRHWSRSVQASPSEHPSPSARGAKRQ